MKSFPTVAMKRFPAVSIPPRAYPLFALCAHPGCSELSEEGGSYGACVGHRRGRWVPWSKWNPSRALRADTLDRFERTNDSGVRTVTYGFAGHVHRFGGPAVVSTAPGNETREERWYAYGLLHRVDGPARSGGPGAVCDYYLAGATCRGFSGLVDYLDRLPLRRLRREFEISSYAPLLAEGVQSKRVVEILGEGVRTLGGIREVLEGAPPEWVAAYEAGAMSVS